MDYLSSQKELISHEQLKEKVCLICGAGGLGSHQLVEANRLGLKKIYILDYDILEISNLNRQTIYGRKDVGKEKIFQAEKFIKSFELDTRIEVINSKIDKNFKIPKDVDIVLDAVDNFETRYLIAEKCWEKKIPFIHGGVEAWNGQITTVLSGKTKRFEEIFPKGVKPKGKMENFAPAVSVIASLQVLEMVKILLEEKKNLLNKILLIDLSLNSFDILNLD